MARKSKSEIMNEAYTRARGEFGKAWSATTDQRRISLEDRRFHTVAGAQWDGSIGEQFEKKIKLEADKIHRQFKRAETEYRENRITVDFISKEGDEYDELADLCDGLFRADAQDSQAEEAVDNTFCEGIGGGFGAWRLTSKYEDEYDEDDERQRICFEPIYEADQSVLFDPNAKLYDKSDAKFAFIITPMTPEAFEEEWDEDPASWPTEYQTQNGFRWTAPDYVYVAEYFVVEEGKRTVLKYTGPTGEEEKEYQDELTEERELELAALGFALSGEKRIKVRRVHKYIMSGNGILEDCGYIAGTEIPIVPFYAERAFVNGSEHWMGLVRKAKDVQRLYNMQLSQLAGISARGGVDKPIFTPQQMKGFEYEWSMDSVEDYPFLRINPVDGPNGEKNFVGPLGNKTAPQVPQALAALMQTSNNDIADILGNQDQGDEYSANLSGKAIELVQNRLDRQVYLYMSNLAKSMKRCGQIWLAMARDVYVEEKRKMKIVDEQDQVEFDMINQPAITDEGLGRKNDLREAKFDVTVDVGATSASARAATVRALGSILPMVQNPEAQSVILATIGRNMEGEGINGMREYFRKQLVALGVEEPTDDDRQAAAEAPPPEPNAQEQYLMAEAQKSQAQAMESQADTEKAIADTEYTRARTAETLSSIDVDRQKAAIDAAVKLREAATTPPLNQ